MRFALAEANWGDDDGTTSLAIVTPTGLDRPSEYGRAATGYQTAEIGYEFDSTYDPTVNDHPDPTPVIFYPNELRDIITEVRNTLPIDPFSPANFDVLVDWADDQEGGEGLLAEIGTNKKGKWCKQLKMLRNDGGHPYLKVQRGAHHTWLRGSPTLGRKEFDGVFGNVTVI